MTKKVRAGVWVSGYAAINVDVTSSTTTEDLTMQLQEALESVNFYPEFGEVGSFELDMEPCDIKALLSEIKSKSTDKQTHSLNGDFSDKS